MVTFNIVEGSSSDEFYPIYEKIKKDIKNGLTPADCREKYNITLSRWGRFQRALIKDKIRPSRKEILKNAKYYTYNKKERHWVVSKTIDNRRVHFCYCTSEEQAKYIVKELKKCNWNKRKVKSILKKMSEEGGEHERID